MACMTNMSEYNDLYQVKTDEHLADLCRKKDNLAFQELMNRHVKSILHFIRQYAKENEEAEDITQDTFFKVWKNISYFSKSRTFKPWLYAIARNTALDWLKKKKALVFSDLNETDDDMDFAETLESPEPLPSRLYEDNEMSQALNKAMINIHPDHQAVLVLHYENQMTFEQIASILGKPMNTIKSWHRRALAKLRKGLAHQMDDGSRTNNADTSTPNAHKNSPN